MATNDPLGTVQRMFAAFRAGDLDRSGSSQMRSGSTPASATATERELGRVVSEIGKADLYREKVTQLAQGLEHDENRTAAAEALRGLIDAIVLTRTHLDVGEKARRPRIRW